MTQVGVNTPWTLGTAKRPNICIVAISQNSRLRGLQGSRQQIYRPEGAILARPTPAWIAVQTMYEDNIDLGVGMRVYLGDFVAFDVVEVDSGALCLHVIVSLVCPALYLTPIGFACTYHACALFSVLCLPHTLHETRTG